MREDKLNEQVRQVLGQNKMQSEKRGKGRNAIVESSSLHQKHESLPVDPTSQHRSLPWGSPEISVTMAHYDLTRRIDKKKKSGGAVVHHVPQNPGIVHLSTLHAQGSIRETETKEAVEEPKQEKSGKESGGKSNRTQTKTLSEPGDHKVKQPLSHYFPVHISYNRFALVPSEGAIVNDIRDNCRVNTVLLELIEKQLNSYRALNDQKAVQFHRHQVPGSRIARGSSTLQCHLPAIREARLKPRPSLSRAEASFMLPKQNQNSSEECKSKPSRTQIVEKSQGAGPVRLYGNYKERCLRLPSKFALSKLRVIHHRDTGATLLPVPCQHPISGSASGPNVTGVVNGKGGGNKLREGSGDQCGGDSIEGVHIHSILAPDLRLPQFNWKRENGKKLPRNAGVKRSISLSKNQHVTQKESMAKLSANRMHEESHYDQNENENENENENGKRNEGAEKPKRDRSEEERETGTILKQNREHSGAKNLAWAVIPTNLQSEEEAFFTSGCSANPQFVYDNPKLSQRTFASFQKPDRALLPLAIQIIAAFLARYTSETQHLEHDGGHILSVEDTREAFERYIEELQLTEYIKLRFASNTVSPTTITHDAKTGVSTITICVPIEYRRNKIQGVLNHEIGTHFIRKFNDQLQPLCEDLFVLALCSVLCATV